MSYFPHPELGNVSSGYYVLSEDASTQATEEDFLFLEPLRDASTQTIEEYSVIPDPFQEASTQTIEEDFVFPELFHNASTLTAEEDFNSPRELQYEEVLNSTTTSESSAETSEKIFVTRKEWENNCGLVNTQILNVSSSLGDSQDVDDERETRNRLSSNDMQIGNTIPVQTMKRNAPNIETKSSTEKRSRNVCEMRGEVLSTNTNDDATNCRSPSRIGVVRPMRLINNNSAANQ